MQPVRVTTRILVSGHAQELLSLLDRQRLRRSALATGRRPNQRGHVPAYEVVGRGVPDGPYQAVVRELQ